MKKAIYILTILIVFFTFSNAYSAGMAPPPPGGGMTPPCWPPSNCIPIDGGVVFLIVAGAALGLKKIYDLKKRSQNIV